MPVTGIISSGIKWAYGGTAASQSNLTTYTFNNVPIGPAAANRRVYVALTGFTLSTRSIVGVTVDGQACSIKTSVPSVGSSDSVYVSAIAESPVIAAGTTATVAVTFSAGMTNCAIHTVAVYGRLYADAVDTFAQNLHSEASINVPIDVLAGGLLLINYTSAYYGEPVYSSATPYVSPPFEELLAILGVKPVGASQVNYTEVLSVELVAEIWQSVVAVSIR